MSYPDNVDILKFRQQFQQLSCTVAEHELELFDLLNEIKNTVVERTKLRRSERMSSCLIHYSISVSSLYDVRMKILDDFKKRIHCLRCVEYLTQKYPSTKETELWDYKIALRKESREFLRDFPAYLVNETFRLIKTGQFDITFVMYYPIKSEVRKGDLNDPQIE